MKRYLGIQAVVVAGALCSGPLLVQAQQQDFDAGPPVRHRNWRTSLPDDSTSVDVTYFIDTASGVTPLQVSMIQQAAAAWSSPNAGALVTLTESPVPGANITIAVAPFDLVQPSGTLVTNTGQLGVFPDGHPWHRITDADIFIDPFPSDPFIFDSNPNNPMPPGFLDFYSAMLREFGRALGLGFENGTDPASVMDATLTAGESHRSLSAGDRAAIQHLYGTPEPATWALFGIGIAGLAISRKRRARADKNS